MGRSVPQARVEALIDLHRAQTPAVLDHSRALPQGGGCAAPKRCPGCGGRAEASRDIPVGLRPTLTIYTCWLTKTLHRGPALPSSTAPSVFCSSPPYR